MSTVPTMLTLSTVHTMPSRCLAVMLLSCYTVFAQSPSLPNFSTAQPGEGTRFESTEGALNTAATRVCSPSTLVVTRTSGTVLSIANGSSSSAIQYVNFLNRTRSVTAASTLTISSGSATGSVDVYGVLSQNTVSGTLQYVFVNNSANVLSASSGTVVTTPPTSPSPVIRLYTWTMTTGTFDVSGGTDQATNTDCWIDWIRLTNNTASSATVTITDNQGTPVNFFNSNLLPGNTTWTLAIPGGEFYEGGLLVNAGTANAVSMKVRGLMAPRKGNAF